MFSLSNPPPDYAPNGDDGRLYMDQTLWENRSVGANGETVISFDGKEKNVFLCS